MSVCIGLLQTSFCLQPDDRRLALGSNNCLQTSSSEESSTMTSSNVSRVHEYLQALASLGPYETVADFYTADVTIKEFPNRIAPHGRIRRLSDIRAAYERGREILKSQSYRVHRILEAGDE